jgi:hypothetical protein
MGMIGDDRKPWDQKTDEEKAKAVGDHLVHEALFGNLRPASQDKNVKTKNPKPSPQDGPEPPWKTQS